MFTEFEGMHYEGDCIRPPSEADSILLQVTVGCSHNKCTFCSTYKNKIFKLKDEKIILHDILFASNYMRSHKRLFLMDGDVLSLPQKKLIWLFDTINHYIPWLERIGSYANARGLKRKSVEDLIVLRQKKLGILYVGIESGHDDVLRDIKKGVTSKELYEQCKKIKEAGIKLSVTVILGIGGKDKSLDHAKATGELLTKIDPDYVGALTLLLIPGTPLYDKYKKREFVLPSQKELLIELREIIRYTNLSSGLFTSNHASNYLPLRIQYPHEKKYALDLIDAAIEGKVKLRDEFLRAL